MEIFRKSVPKGLTFAESFSFIGLIAHYLFFYIETLQLKLNGTANFTAGGASQNLVIFVPVRVFFKLIHKVGLLHAECRFSVSPAKAFQAINFGARNFPSLIFGRDGPHDYNYHSQSLHQVVSIAPFLSICFSMIDIFTKNYGSFLMIYMAATLTVGLLMITFFSKEALYANFTIRKTFHLLAFFLFTPGVIINVRQIFSVSFLK